jgi:NOL1/NOP2/fmu family ribosome biogenesis protein
MSEGIRIENFDTNYGYRRYPHLCRGEGQFMIALQKTCEEDYPHSKFFAKNYESPNKKELDLITKHLKNNTNILELNIIKRNDTFFSMPKVNLDFNNLNVIHIGCMIGTIIKNNFKFAHSFYRMYGNDFKNELELNPDTLIKYLHGEEIDTTLPDGIYAVSYENIFLSGGKVTNNKLKNNYPKELRI